MKAWAPRPTTVIGVAWWDRENELPLRVLVREAGTWRPARGSESICVWDLEVLATERRVYLDTMLRGAGPDPGRWASAAIAVD